MEKINRNTIVRLKFVANEMGCSVSTASRLLDELRKSLGKKKRQKVFMFEFAEYCGLKLF